MALKRPQGPAGTLLFERADTVESIRVSSKSQMIIPKRVREALGPEEGDRACRRAAPRGRVRRAAEGKVVDFRGGYEDYLAGAVLAAA